MKGRRNKRIDFQKITILIEVTVKPHAMQRYCERILGTFPEGSDKEVSTRISREIVELVKSGRIFALARQRALVIKSGFRDEKGELIEVYLLLRFKNRNSEIEIVTVFDKQVTEEYIAKGKMTVFAVKKSKKQRRMEITEECGQEEEK